MPLVARFVSRSIRNTSRQVRGQFGALKMAGSVELLPFLRRSSPTREANYLSPDPLVSWRVFLG
jgi:hypothetical protein